MFHPPSTINTTEKLKMSGKIQIKEYAMDVKMTILS